MKYKATYLTVIFLFVSIISIAQTTISNVKKTTEIYSIKGSDTLRLDRYELPSVEKEKPCIVFMFGGGFVAGTRDRKDYIPFFNHLAEKGYTVASIDYRLGLKKAGIAKALQDRKDKENGVKPKKSGAKDFLKLFDSTINMAVEDLYDATNYIITHAGEWKINKNMIIACGSSAGAISVLHGEYYISNKADMAKSLPDDFNYAGIISFAGAIFSMNGDLKWKEKPAPMLLFHGDADMNVPYDKARVKILGIFPLKYGFWGSKHIAGQMDKMKNPYYFYDVENANHVMADSPMKNNWNEIDTFLNKFVEGKQKLSVNNKVKQIDKPDVKKNFGIKDYLKGNNLDGKAKK